MGGEDLWRSSAWSTGDRGIEHGEHGQRACTMWSVTELGWEWGTEFTWEEREVKICRYPITSLASLIIQFLKIYFCLCICAWVWVTVWNMCASTRWGQLRALHHLELELEVVVSLLKWVQGTKLRSSIGATSNLNHCTVSTAPIGPLSMCTYDLRTMRLCCVKLLNKWQFVK